MYLSHLSIRNFRKLSAVDIHFQPGLNILVGTNNVGKTAAVDALRALLFGHDEPSLRLSVEDICKVAQEKVITFTYVFGGLSLDDEADFLPALKQGPDQKMEAHFTVRYSDADNAGRLRVRRWCGDHQENGLTSEMMENLRGVYLPPLRDASQGLKPGRASQLARLLHLLTDEKGKAEITKELEDLDTRLKKHRPVVDTETAITMRHKSMLGEHLAQILEVGLSAIDFQRMCARLSLLVDKFEIEQNGLGFNNLIYMAVVLSELTKNPESAYRGLIVEEPEAHLHPQLQAVLLRYLESINTPPPSNTSPPNGGDKPVQVFVTSHSPTFASAASLDCLACIIETDTGVETFFPRNITFQKRKKEKLQRYLDVTRAELFFASRIIFVEGTGELMLINVLAQKAGYDLREHGVSLISVEGLNFDSFVPLFGKNALKIPVAVITDADPAGTNPNILYPALNSPPTLSSNTSNLKMLEDDFVKVFHGLKTLEYDLALLADNHKAMLDALIELHPTIGANLQKAVEAAADADKPKTLFIGMFERDEGKTNIKKGEFAQALAQAFIENGAKCDVPEYIKDACKHVCK